ncbi:hypothetical protein ACM64Y_02955 [Novispirillum sp. DQ9]|uniref:hypothetical protein n=1 Tax=Novispirillum sp. DQ9 TaxID=3398612 RepID=UPI003C7D4CEA
MMQFMMPQARIATEIAFDGTNGQPALPYPKVAVPPYREASGPNWRFSAFYMPACAGYFHGPRPIDWMNWGLVRDGRTWMSLTPWEIESQLPVLAAARGTVAVCGLGMGLIAHAIAHLPGVEQVKIIERDPEVVEVFRRFSGYDDWTVRDRVEIILSDAMDPALAGHIGPVDVLYADIWPYLRMDCMVPDMQRIFKAIPAPVCGYWGQELDAVDWAAARGVPVAEFSAEHFNAFRKDIGLPLYGLEEPTYIELCRLAASNPSISMGRKT